MATITHVPDIPVHRPRWRPERSRLATRMALRDMRTHRARTLLMLLLVLLPCALVGSIGDLLGGESPTTMATQMGSATGHVSVLQQWDGRCHQDATLTSDECDTAVPMSSAKGRSPSAPLASVVPAGHALLFGSGTATVRHRGTDFTLALLSGDFADPRLHRAFQPNRPGMPGAQEMSASVATARRFGWRVGDQVVVDGRRLTVHSIVRTTSGDLLVSPASPIAAPASSALLFDVQPTATMAQALNAKGWALESRAAIEAQGSDNSSVWTVEVALAFGVPAAIVAGALSSAAFAITVRGQRRSLALLSTTGATGRMLQRVVLRQGLLVGLSGTLLGIALGTTVSLLLQRHRHEMSDVPVGGLHVNPVIMVAAIAVGLGSALLAAWVPGRQVARQDALQALRTSDAGSPPARPPAAGIMLLVLGALTGCLPVLQESPSATGSDAHPEHVVTPASVAVALLFVGAALCVPWVLDRLGRRPRGGLPVRLALRDAARTRSRATGAVCAVMALVTLAGAWLTAVFGLGAQEVRAWTPQGPPGFGAVTMTAPATADPGNEGTPWTPATLTPAQQDAITAQVQRVLGTHTPILRTQQTQAYASVPTSSTAMAETPVVVGDSAMLRFWLRHDPPAEAVHTLEHGGAVVLDRRVVTPGDENRVVLEMPDSSEHPVAAVVVDAVANAPVVVSPDTARRLHLGTGDTSLGFDAGAMVTPRQSEQLQTSLTDAGLNASVFAETGPRDDYSHVGRELAAVLLVVTLGASGVITALTLGDARPTHETLAAIGASRRTLRRMVGVQAMVTTGLGAVAGLLVGFVPMALAIAGSHGYVPLVVPWRWALAFCGALPLGAGMVAWLLVRPAQARAVPAGRGLQ